jgi:hypothetical protein
MTRRDFRVVLHELPRAHFEILQALDGRRSLAESGGHVPLAEVRDGLADWAGKGLLARI